MKVIVLGAGLVGGPMAVDLARESRFEVSVADMDQEALQRIAAAHPVRVIQQDVTDSKKLSALLAKFDLVLNAVPGFLGFRTLQTVIEAGKSVVDIAFFPEDPFLLDGLARGKKVSAIVDCGIAPGMSNVLVGHVDRLLEETESVLIYVGGLPELREWPYEYRAVFSPADVIEEYTRPARFLENGCLVTRPALSDAELINFPEIGTLEAFNTDGLRTLATTIRAPNLKEKTLRYPGHIEKMKILRETGFFSREEIEIQGTKIRPLDFTAKILFPKWKLKEGERDITVMQVAVAGRKAGRRIRYLYDLFDRYDTVSRTHSMARTTGYTATSVLRLLADGLFTRQGICPPEYIGQQPECVQSLLEQLRQRGVSFRQSVCHLDDCSPIPTH